MDKQTHRTDGSESPSVEPPDDDRKVRIFLNTNVTMSRGKAAAHAVHAALTAAGVHPGLPVVVLGAKPRDIEAMATSIHDEGRTELEPGTLTAGTDWKPRSKVVYITAANRPDDSEYDAAIAEAESFGEAIFELSDKYKLPLTNNEERWQDGVHLREISEFMGEIRAIAERFPLPSQTNQPVANRG